MHAHPSIYSALVLCLASAAADAFPAPALASPTTPGTLTTYATILSAGFEWRITGDDDDDCTVDLEYRRLGASPWNPAQPLRRVANGLWTHGEDPGNLLAGSLFFLDPGTTYEARLTLNDPDGGAEQRTVSFTTRTEPQASNLRTLYVIPGTGGGAGTQSDPFLGLAAADAAALPGDVFLLQPGTYFGTFTPTRDGNATDPIVYRGESAATVVLDGNGGAGANSHCVNLTGRRFVFIENMSLVNCLRPLNADNTEGVVVRSCTVEPIDQLLYAQGIRAAMSVDLFIADNTIRMPGRWETIGRTGSYGTGGYGILIEGTGHIVCYNTIIQSWDAISIPVTGTAVPAVITSNVDIYGNFVDRASDDGVQSDAVNHNIRVFRNRLLNTGSAISFQPSFGGPCYVLFNELFNTRIQPYKLHQEIAYGWTQETSGFVVCNNTSVCSRNAWYDTGIAYDITFRNNLLIGGRENTYSYHVVYSAPDSDMDHDGFNRVSGFDTLAWFNGAPFEDMPSLYAGTGNEGSGVEVSASDFVTLVHPHNPEWEFWQTPYGAPYAPEEFDLRLAFASLAIDAGQPLPNITDGFSGAAPDIGCYEFGSVVPAYGPRSVPPSTGIAAPGPHTIALLSTPNPFVHFTRIHFALRAEADVRLDVFDVNGARVRSIEGRYPAGAHAIVWDGLSSGGRPAAVGVYFVRLSAGAVRGAVRVVRAY